MPAAEGSPGWSLAGRTALVTGAGAGIGAAIAARLASAGARVAVADVDGDRARAVASGLSPAALPLPLDVQDVTAVRAAFDRAQADFGPVDVLVNNAGVYPTASIIDITDEDWERVLAVNLTGAFLCTREMIRRLRALGVGGVIVNVASTAAVVARPFASHYCASKAALVQFTRSVALETAQDNIRVVALCPGLVETEGVQRMVADGGEREHMAKLARIPMGRSAEPGEVAGVALFLASNDASYMTGSVVLVDGGYTAGNLLPGASAPGSEAAPTW